MMWPRTVCVPFCEVATESLVPLRSECLDWAGFLRRVMPSEGVILCARLGGGVGDYSADRQRSGRPSIQAGSLHAQRTGAMRGCNESMGGGCKSAGTSLGCPSQHGNPGRCVHVERDATYKMGGGGGHCPNVHSPSHNEPSGLSAPGPAEFIPSAPHPLAPPAAATRAAAPVGESSAEQGPSTNSPAVEEWVAMVTAFPGGAIKHASLKSSGRRYNFQFSGPAGATTLFKLCRRAG